MEVVTGAMGTLLLKLGGLLKEEYDLQKNIRGEIMFLKAELESMEAALLRISAAPIDQPPDIQTKLWARDVKDLSYDIEDSVDKFMVRVDKLAPNNPHSFRGFIDTCLNLLTKAKLRYKLGTEVNDIKSRIMEVSERRDRYKVDGVVAKPSGPSIDSLRLSALYKKVSDLVGTEERSNELVTRLKEGDRASKQQLKIVSIVGFGGLGKTTLANVVYQKLKVEFDSVAFVCLSLNPNMEKVFKNMLHQLDKHKYSNINEAMWGETQLMSELREFLQNKKYFIVIDDIWGISVWEKIKYALVENAHGSRVIATTRILDVAKQVGCVYQLKPLSSSDSRELFYQRIFGKEDKHPPYQLAQISRNILARCGGVPLAIITIASMLASKKAKENALYWSKVYQSMGSGLGDSPDVKDMRKILSVSYYDLSPQLKTCLLYLSLYPEDYEIETKVLIWKWVGEGFVHEKQGKSMYEVGEGYFDELINKSLIQPVHIDSDNKVSSCRIHDMVLDFITSLSNEDNFLTIVGCQQPVFVPSKIRRISLQISKEENVQVSTMSLPHVRSLTVFNQAFTLLPALSGCPVLRALDLSGCKQVDNHHCKDICNLVHLRYLSLHGTSVSEIPKEIGNLQLLQVLDISCTEIDEELPSTFVQLTQLVFVDMLGSTVYAVPRWMSSLSSLSSLSITLETLGEDEVQVLGSMLSLSDLYIWVAKPTQSTEEWCVIDSGYPFCCLTRFSIKSDTMKLVFAQGAMQKLQTLELHVMKRLMYGLGDSVLGLENLSSLEHVFVKIEYYNRKLLGKVGSEIQGQLDMNPNKPTVNLSGTYPTSRTHVYTDQVQKYTRTIIHHFSWHLPGMNQLEKFRLLSTVIMFVLYTQKVVKLRRAWSLKRKNRS